MNALQIYLKRIVDLIVGSFALACLSPILVLIALAVRLTSPGPALFRQQRLGKDGVPFSMYKFRTMCHGVSQRKAPDGSSLVIKGDPRITPLGRFLRAFSLDEFPQLMNVLKGEMSLVGPRPDQVDHLSLYTAEDWRKLTMKPGLTGLAMVHGRNAIPWKERVTLDISYVEHYSLWLDLKIILQTIPVLLGRKGVYTDTTTLSRGKDKHA